MNLGPCSGQGISAPRTEGISGLFQKIKQPGWFSKCLCRYSTEVSRFVFEILEKLNVIASVIP